MRITKTLLASLAALLATTLVLTAFAPTNVQAYVEGDGGVFLLDDGGDEYNESSTEYQAFVETPDWLATEDDEWEFEIYLEYLNLTESDTGYDPSYGVIVHIDDGDLNKSFDTDEITESDAEHEKVYANLTVDEDTIGLFRTNDSAQFTASLYNDTTSDTNDTTSDTNDTYTTEISLSESQLMPPIMAVIPALVSIMIVAVVIGWLGDIGKKIRRGFK